MVRRRKMDKNAQTEIRRFIELVKVTWFTETFSAATKSFEVVLQTVRRFTTIVVFVFTLAMLASTRFASSFL